MDIMNEEGSKLSMWFRVEALTHRLKEAESFIKEKEHYWCEDGWYSCPKARDGCDRYDSDGECDCGADAHNQRVDKYWEKYGKD